MTVRQFTSRALALGSIVALALSVIGVALVAFIGNGRIIDSILKLGSIGVALLAGALSSWFALYLRRHMASRRVFLSYRGRDAVVAEAIARYLRSEGMRVWIDTERLRVGSSISDAVERGLADSDVMLLLWSGEAGAWMEKEIAIARSKHVPLLPVAIGGASIPERLEDVKSLRLDSAEPTHLAELSLNILQLKHGGRPNPSL